MRAQISEIANYKGKEVTLKGWVYNKTKKGKLIFILIRDGTGIIQGVVFKPEVSEEIFERCSALTQESSIIVKGKVREERRAPGGFELCIEDLEIVHLSDTYPISPKEHGVSFLLDHRHLWIRSKRQHAILRVRSEVIRAIHDFFEERGFVQIDAPILTPTACEGTTNLFGTEYFDQTAYLTQSGQLYMEAACAAFGKVYCFGPTFRAEKSKTRRHLTEFWMVEPEVAFAELDDIIGLAEELLTYVVDRILRQKEEELSVLGRDKAPLLEVKPPFPRISYREAIEIIEEEYKRIREPQLKKELEIRYGEDFGGFHETVVAKHFTKPVVIERYPASCKAFYMKPDPKDPTLVLCFDIFAPEGYGEVIGGSQRIDDLGVLECKLEEFNLPKEAFDWYLDLRRYGSFPHGGFGLGLERTIAWICGVEHVRECIPFPRMIYRLHP
jgi:asparaginyl-tRNA synthetase